MLECEQMYKEQKKDPAPTLERKMNAKLLSLKKKGSIPDGLYERLRRSSGKTPQLYRLPKVHIPGVPLRPIASFIQSLTYQLSKYLSTILSPLLGKSQSAVKNSREFDQFIREQKLSEEEVLVSFYVVSLFTNVHG